LAKFEIGFKIQFENVSKTLENKKEMNSSFLPPFLTFGLLAQLPAGPLALLPFPSLSLSFLG
jgi:hypothetical protein